MDTAEEEPDAEIIGQAAGAALQDIFAEHERGFILKWIALVETAAPDGTRGLWCLTSDDLQAWDTVGMLGHALHLQQAQTLGESTDD